MGIEEDELPPTDTADWNGTDSGASGVGLTVARTFKVLHGYVELHFGITDVAA